MFFQVNISPLPKVEPQKKITKKESEEVTVLSLAFFTPNPKLFFEDVKVGTEAVRELLVRNPNNQDITLYLTRAPSQERNVTFSWYEAVIGAHDEVPLYITWTPTAAETRRENLTLEDGNRIRRDIPVVFKSVQPKTKNAKKSTKKKVPVFISKKVKSPIKTLKTTTHNKRTPPKSKTTTFPNITNLPKILRVSPRNSTYTISNKENSIPKQDVFNDSLEATSPETYACNRLQFKINSSQFAFTPLSSPNFCPTVCSSNEKSTTSNKSDVVLDFSRNLNRALNFSTSTFVKEPLSSDTYVKTSLDSETYIKANLSSATYVKESISPILFSHVNGRRMKRKCDTVEEESLMPLKKPHLNSTSRKEACDPFTLAKTHTLDPFIDLHHEPQWFDEQALHFKKWLNALLTPPPELGAEARHPVDVARIWRECKRSEVALAPTKDAVSSSYHTSKRLDGLREAAIRLYRSVEVKMVLRKTFASVESGKLSVREDRDIHLDLGLQAAVMSLLLSYNPLWLRIGLETIYNTTIPLRSNSDIMGLNHFLLTRFFKDPALVSKHKTVLTNKYAADIKKFLLKKYLALVYFLDLAKTRKLIKHDPCLFCKDAPVKQSKEMLFQFCKEAIHATGDIIKYLRHLGYTVCHEQIYINEFDFAVNNLGTDLRDGVRLTKIVEIVLLEQDLLKELRVPAVSRLQKIHNVRVAFSALQRAGFEIISNIEPKDVVEGHKEKTLSLLWQILYKFEAPFIVKAVSTVQSWWRSLSVVVKRRICAKNWMKRCDAAVAIQKWYRRMKLSQKIEGFIPLFQQYLEYMKREKAAVKIQSYFKMYIAKKRYVTVKKSVLLIQTYSRKYLLMCCVQKNQRAAVAIQNFFRTVLARKEYLKLKFATLCIQKHFRAKKQRQEYLHKKQAAMKIQEWYRTTTAMKKEKKSYQRIIWATLSVQRHFRTKKQRQEFLKMKHAARTIQDWYRATCFMKLERRCYQKLLWSTLYIQRRFKTKKQRLHFLNVKSAAMRIQEWYRSVCLMRQQKQHYQRTRRAILCVQQHFRVKKQRQQFLNIKVAVVKIQEWYRATRLMKKEKQNYQRTLSVILYVQRTFRANKQRQEFLNTKHAAIKIQKWYRATRLMRIERYCYQRILWATLYTQQSFRAKKQRQEYSNMKRAAARIQEWYRATRLMRKQKRLYQRRLQATLCIQRHFRARKQRQKFLSMKCAAIRIQEWYRATCLMWQEQRCYKQIIWATLCVQQHFRAKKQRQQFLNMKHAASKIQEWYRATRQMRKQKQNYQRTLCAILYVQQHFRAKKQRQKFLNSRCAALKIQQWYRATRLMKKEKQCYQRILCATLFIQQSFRAKKQRQEFLCMKSAASKIQEWYRATCAMKKERLHYQRILWATLCIQQHFRTKKQRQGFLKMKCAAKTVQERYRATRLMRKQRQRYQKALWATLYIQQSFRAKKCRRQFLNLRCAAIKIQEWYRATSLMRKEKSDYQKMLQAALCVQQRYRTKKLRQKFLNMKQAASKIQERYRAKRLMRQERRRYQRITWATIFIQQHFKANKQRREFLNMKIAATRIQVWYRAASLTKKERCLYQRKRQAILRIQQYFRAKKQRQDFLNMKRAATQIQEWYRATCLMRTERYCYQRALWAAVLIQQKFRANRKIKTIRLVVYKLSIIAGIQKHARGFLARQRYGNLLREEDLLRLRQSRREQRAAVKIQAVWRGHVARKSNPQVTKIRKRSIVAQLNADPSKTLGHLRDKAVEILGEDNVSLSQIILALQDLEFITRRCKSTCKNLCKELAEKIYVILCVAARSVPEMKACEIATCILINFCKYPPTTDSSWHPHFMDNLFTLMINWCDKESFLFPYLCTLIWLFAHNEKRRDYIVNIPNIRQKVEKIHGLITRKQNMVSRQRFKGTSSVFDCYKRLPLPSLNPDWGLELKHEPRTFTNSVHAFDSLVKILDFN